MLHFGLEIEMQILLGDRVDLELIIYKESTLLLLKVHQTHTAPPFDIGGL
jgi:hypothetical protein